MTAHRVAEVIGEVMLFGAPAPRAATCPPTHTRSNADLAVLNENRIEILNIDCPHRFAEGGHRGSRGLPGSTRRHGGCLNPLVCLCDKGKPTADRTRVLCGQRQADHRRVRAVGPYPMPSAVGDITFCMQDKGPHPSPGIVQESVSRRVLKGSCTVRTATISGQVTPSGFPERQRRRGGA